MVELLPQRLAAHTESLRRQGVLMPGAVAALNATRDHPGYVPTVVTDNLKPNALLKLAAFNLANFLDTEIGGFASDDQHRPALVAISPRRGLKSSMERSSPAPTLSSLGTPSRMSGLALKADPRLSASPPAGPRQPS
nr:haloacid dehalogenase-like hydrolase [Streptomyces abikoensis]